MTPLVPLRQPPPWGPPQGVRTVVHADAGFLKHVWAATFALPLAERGRP